MIDSVTTQFDQCRQALVAQREPLVQAITDAKRVEAEASTLLKQLDRAIAALDGQGVARGSKKADGKSASRKSCSNKDEVMTLIKEGLASSPKISKDELKQQVALKLKERGRSLSMYANLFARCVEELPSWRRGSLDIHPGPAGQQPC